MKIDVHFTGISGSLHKKSFNTYRLNNVVSLLAGGVALEITSVAGIPLYDADIGISHSKINHHQ